MSCGNNNRWCGVEMDSLFCSWSAFEAREIGEALQVEKDFLCNFCCSSSLLWKSVFLSCFKVQQNRYGFFFHQMHYTILDGISRVQKQSYSCLTLLFIQIIDPITSFRNWVEREHRKWCVTRSVLLSWNRFPSWMFHALASYVTSESNIHCIEKSEKSFRMCWCEE